jgi:hypothetical protein
VNDVRLFDASGREFSILNGSPELLADTPERPARVTWAIWRILRSAAHQLVVMGCNPDQVSSLRISGSLGLGETVTKAADLLAEFPGSGGPLSDGSLSMLPLRDCLRMFEPPQPPPGMPIPMPGSWLHNLWHRITGTH